MKRLKNFGPVCALVVGSLPFIVTAHAQRETSPVTYHQSFDNWSFLADDYSAMFPDVPLEKRHLRLTSGKFGQALANENVFSAADFEKTYMSTRDLDVLLEVLCYHRFKYYDLNVGGRHPYFWGTGRVRMDAGTVAFWIKGEHVGPGSLFFQGSSSFGRLEKYLLSIRLNEDQTIEACVVDASYRRHVVKSGPVWQDRDFNHVALAWERSAGLVLYFNGQPVASNWGTDAWWTAQMPGLFEMPMCGTTQDELWIFDRPLLQGEVQRLMRDNEPPLGDTRPSPMTNSSAQALRKALVGAGESTLAIVRPSEDQACLTFQEIQPTWVGDGAVTVHGLTDGRYEMAWPTGYTSFTNILGDGDYQPEKMDLRLPEDVRVNYTVLEGNLAEARVLVASTSSLPTTDMAELFKVPQDGRFLHAQMIPELAGATFRIPFLKGYGSPPGYSQGLHLPLTGDIRIHEVGFFNVHPGVLPLPGNSTRALSIGPSGGVPEDGRYGYAMRALNDGRNAAVRPLIEADGSDPGWVSPGPFTRLNLLTLPFAQAQAIKAITLNLNLRRCAEDTVCLARVHDPGVPARIWTSLPFRLTGFGSGGGMASVRLDITDIKAAAGDRLWLDIAFSDETEIEVGGKARSQILFEQGDLNTAAPESTLKALRPALSSFTKIYYWYYPWTLTQQDPDPLAPVTFGGYYDIVNCPLAIKRADPDSYPANLLTNLALIGSRPNLGATFDAWENSPKFWPPLRVSNADDSPDWAFYMNYYLVRFKEIVDWWADRQHSDGQVGGGWNDDCLFAGRLPGPLLYMGDRKARRLFDRVFRGHEVTGMLRNGYCGIIPIDSMHAEDRVRHRYEGLLFEPGNPHKMKLAMETARWFGKPNETPANYGNGQMFKYDHDLLVWYWGRTSNQPVYSTTREQVTAKLKELAPAMNDVIRFRYTEAGMYTDGAYMPGCYDVRRILIGGGWGPFAKDLTLAASWEAGGEASIPKWVERASDTDFVAHLYSYDPAEREVAVRLYRLRKGIYSIILAGEGKDESKGIVCRSEKELRRFSIVTIPLRPGREMVLQIKLIRELPDTGPLPDLAVDELRVQDGRLQAEVLNFGVADAGPFKVRLEDASGRLLAEQTVPRLAATANFVPATELVRFPGVTSSNSALRVTVDPERTIEEITTENNVTYLVAQ